MDEQRLVELIKQTLIEVLSEFRITRRRESKKTKPPKPSQSPPKTAVYLQRFEQFWEAYPKARRKGKGAARKIWLRLKPSRELTDQILNALGQQKKQSQWQKDNGQFIPHPATWLNQARWEDEITEDEQLSEIDKVLGPTRNPTVQEEKMLTELKEGE